MSEYQERSVAAPLELPLLKFESAEQYLDLRERLTKEIKPKGALATLQNRHHQ
jgi:hypothetical protein